MQQREVLLDALRGVVAVTLTPFDSDGGIDEAAYTALIGSMAQAGITAFTPSGNTGEFYALTIPETERLVELTIAAAGPDALILPGVGHDAKTAAQMAVTAESAGARAVMVHHPVAPYLSVDGWVDFHRMVSEAVPALGIVAYVRDPKIDSAAIARLLEEVPALAGVKFALPDPFALSAAINTVGADRIAWICGLAERWAPFYWLAGAQGFTSGLANVAPAASVQMLESLRAGDFEKAMGVWRTISPMEEMRSVRGGANNVSALKEALEQLGRGQRSVRPPASLLNDEDRRVIDELMDQWGRAGLLPST